MQERSTFMNLFVIKDYRKNKLNNNELCFYRGSHGSMRTKAQENREIKCHSTVNFAYVYIQPLFGHTIGR